MLFPRSYAFTRTQRSLILVGAIVALASLGAFIYSYERYHSPASESILYGTWQIPDTEDPLYFEFRADQTFSIVAVISGHVTPIMSGRWYAGGRNIYLRFRAEDVGQRRPLILHIVDITRNQLRARIWRDGKILTYHRVDLKAPSASNKTMQRPHNPLRGFRASLLLPAMVNLVLVKW
jgi:hypothetical protein